MLSIIGTYSFYSKFPQSSGRLPTVIVLPHLDFQSKSRVTRFRTRQKVLLSLPLRNSLFMIKVGDC